MMNFFFLLFGWVIRFDFYNIRRRNIMDLNENIQYRYYLVRNASASWGDAEEHCKHLGGHLIIVNTRDHWMALMDNFLNSGYTPDHW